MLQSRIPASVTDFCRRHRPHVAIEAFLQRWGAAVVVVFAFLYYAQYYRSGLNLGGEGGTVAVVAMRLIDGWLPIKDTFLGYNLMWFYPVVWLFKIFGPSYIALRIFFFAICTLTGVMAYFIVRRATGSGWYATLVALLPVLVPGMLFRNYMAFLAVLNMLVVLQAYVFTQRAAWKQALWMLAAGLSLGLTLLVRVDLGVFFLLINLGAIVLFPLAREGGFARNVGLAAAGLVLLMVSLTATHAPFYLDARARGYDAAFTGQYTGWVGLIRNLLATKIGFDPFAPSPAARPVYTPARVQLLGLWLAAKHAGEIKSGDLDQKEYRPKATLESLNEDKSWSERSLVVVTYLPILVGALVILPSALCLLVAIFRRDAMLRERTMVLLITIGSALTLFPQFFFFRPDTPHLSELMVPLMVAMGCAGWYGALLLTTKQRRRNSLPPSAPGPRPLALTSLAGLAVGGAVIALCAFTTGLYLFHALPKESAGTIAAREKRNREMKAENGVRVWLKKGECEDIQKLADLIKAHSKPGDYLACYPYQPTINFMTDRPAYEYNLYIDNAHNIANFHEETMAKIEKFRPAAIVIDNRPVNQTEESRFQNWAAKTYEWIKAHYTYAGTFRRQELYFRPDLAPAGGALKPKKEKEKETTDSTDFHG